jgi:hypothetical protein
MTGPLGTSREALFLASVVCYSMGMSIRCGSCQERHETTAEVRACFGCPPEPRPDNACGCKPHPLFGHEDSCRYAGAGPTPAARPEHASWHIEGQAGTWGTPADEGVYMVHGRIYRVVVKTNGSGRPFAEEMVRGKYVYAKGMVFRLRPEDRLTLAQAKEWGQKEVRCIRCGLQLTKPASREAGIGPICATKI